MDPIQQNGVTFTPDKVVDLDSYEKSKSQAPTDGGADTSKDTDNTPSDDVSGEASQTRPESVTNNGTDAPENIKNEDGVIADSSGDDIPLSELYFQMDDGEVNASELIDKYSEAKTELDKIKGDEFLNRFVDYYKNGGDPAEFLQKATTKWENVSDVQLMKMQFDADNSDLDDEAKQIIFERELVSKYGINPDGTYDDENSREAKVGKQLLRRDAQKLRSTFAEEQKKFMLPKPKETQQQQFDTNAIKNELLRDKELDSLVKNKAVPIGDGFSYEADPERVIGMMANTADFWKLFQKPDGGWDKSAMAKVFAFAMDPKRYDDHILKLGQDVGSENYIKEQRNTVEKGRARVVDKSTDTSAPFVRGGKIVGNSDDLLKAFLAQKK